MPEDDEFFRRASVVSRTPQLAEKRPPLGDELVDELRKRSSQFLKECEERIRETTQELEYWTAQRHTVRAFLAQDQLMGDDDPLDR